MGQGCCGGGGGVELPSLPSIQKTFSGFMAGQAQAVGPDEVAKNDIDSDDAFALSKSTSTTISSSSSSSS